MTPSQFSALPAEDRELMLAEDELVCSCGNLRSVCSDPEVDWYAQKSVCYASAGEAVTHRLLDEKYGRERTTKPHSLDGVTVWVSDQDLTPDDPFFRFKATR